MHRSIYLPVSTLNIWRQNRVIVGRPTVICAKRERYVGAGVNPENEKYNHQRPRRIHHNLSRWRTCERILKVWLCPGWRSN